MVVKGEHAQDADDAEAGEQSDALVDAEVDEEGPGEEDAAAGEGGAEEVVAGEEGGGVLRVRQGHVDEDALEDDEDGGAVEDDADDARDPGEVGPGGPGEDQEARRRQEAGDEGGHEAVFLRAEAARHDVGFEVEVQVRDVCQQSDNAGHQDAAEEDADGPQGETVENRIHERKDFEEGVVDSVHQGRVEVHKGDGRIFDGDFQGFDEGGHQHR